MSENINIAEIFEADLDYLEKKIIEEEVAHIQGIKGTADTVNSIEKLIDAVVKGTFVKSEKKRFIRRVAK